MPAQRGFTLLELLATLGVCTVLLALAVPSLGNAIRGQRVYHDTQKLYHLIHLARQHAVMSGQRTVLCVLAGGQCQRNWHGVITLFADHNRDNRLDSNEPILSRWSDDERRSEIHWHGFGTGYLRYRPSGTAVENGTFDICPANGERRLARQVVINRVGRAYWSIDTDHDGIVEHGADHEPNCS